MLPFSITFQNIWYLNYVSIPNIREVMKFYNLGDQSFESDASCKQGITTIDSENILLQVTLYHIVKFFPIWIIESCFAHIPDSLLLYC